MKTRLRIATLLGGIVLVIAVSGGIWYTTSILPTIVHSAETGWEYQRGVHAFSEDVNHHAFYQEDGEIWIKFLCVGTTLRISFTAPPGPVYSVVPDTPSVVWLNVRVDEKPYQRFYASWKRGVAHIFWKDAQEYHRLIRDLMQGTKLIFQVSQSNITTVSLAGSAEPISKLLKGCNISLSN